MCTELAISLIYNICDHYESDISDHRDLSKINEKYKFSVTFNISNLLLFIVTITYDYVVILFCICDDDGGGGSFITP